MKEILLETPTIIEESEKPASDRAKKRLRRWTLALYLSMSGGIVCAFAGLGLGAVSYLDALSDAKSVNQIGNLLIIAAFPLMMFGAHALDKFSEIKTTSK